MNGDRPMVRTPQVKICGLTRPDEALSCARLGADAVGLVFYPKSPRHVSIAQGRAIVDALPAAVATVGVFVNADFAEIMARVGGCGLSMVQLHGTESPALVERLHAEGVGVIKALFMGGEPGLAAAGCYAADAFLVECSGGPLPGGNAMAWDWGAAREFGQHRPLVLAGGLTPDNAADAIRAGRPAAIDVSSGVEVSPGRKDAKKVARLTAAVRGLEGQADPPHRSTLFVPRKG